MRPVTVRLSAAGFSPWIPLDHYSASFNVGFGVKLSSNGNLTYSVQHTFDNVLQPTSPASPIIPISRSGTVATVSQTNHGISVADYIGVRGAGVPLDGDYEVASVVDQNSYTYTVANSGVTFAAPGYQFIQARVFNHLVLNAQTASGDGNYSNPIAAIRLYISSFTAGYADLSVYQGGI